MIAVDCGDESRVSPAVRGGVCKRTFKFHHTRLQRLDGRSHLFLSVTRSDVLRAVPVEADHVDQKEALDFSTQVGRGCQLIREVMVLAGVQHASMAEDSQALATRIVHEKKGHAIARRQVARAQKLAVAFEVGKAERLRVEHFQESHWTTAMLHVWPAVACNRRHVKTVAPGDEFRFLRGERVALRLRRYELRTPVIMLLRGKHFRSEMSFKVSAGHTSRN